MALKNITRIVIINLIVLLLLLTIVEIFFGDWLKQKPPVSNLPDTKWDKKITIDATKITGVSDVLYTVDAKGYRGSNDLSANNIVLTIGGSTTEQLLVSDGKTWQDHLSHMNNYKYQFLNGGVGGQTTFGHIYAIEKWHTKELGPAQVRAVIFYFGINDVTLLHEKHNPNETPKLNFYQIRILLLRNSFFYQRLKIIKDNFYSRQHNTANNTTNNHLVWWGHGLRSQPFVNDNSLQIIKPIDNTDYIYYKSLISKLISKTMQGYPSAKIIFVQQQIPACRFLSPFEVIDRRPVSSKDALNYCKALGEVYLSQDEVVMSLPKSEQPKILKMYLGQFISDEGVYDHTHTNETGSAEIAKYLMDNLSL
jgi:hypothetical protein